MSEKSVKVYQFTPQVPNFIKTSIGPVAIERFSDKALRAIGRDWTEALVILAQKRRSSKGKRQGQQR